VAYHIVTLLRDTTEEADAVFSALAASDSQIVFCYPNADAGSRWLIHRAKAFLAQRGHGHIFTNLDALTYWSLLAQVDVFVGNSSSGIMETASFALPTVNVGIRQLGRERPRNVIDVEPSMEAILDGLRLAASPGFRVPLAGMTNPYGDGHASDRIVEVLSTVPLGEVLLLKRACQLPC
jgi:UDP-N-acetylglucosamine 2-epimerase (non-hydrolysing)/GDP/UDP-N,N'-diacetylbacillosamine 2-epimerase (hydrolysing)